MFGVTKCHNVMWQNVTCQVWQNVAWDVTKCIIRTWMFPENSFLNRFCSGVSALLERIGQASLDQASTLQTSACVFMKAVLLCLLGLDALMKSLYESNIASRASFLVAHVSNNILNWAGVALTRRGLPMSFAGGFFWRSSMSKWVMWARPSVALLFSPNFQSVVDIHKV